jgi:CHASE2 domain-containing sensor protein/energy-coupling factor transporter ATP-binding protein EcfA2
MNTFEITVQHKLKDSWSVVAEFTTGDGLVNHAKSLLEFSTDDFAELKELQEDVKEYGQLLGVRLFKGAVRESFLKAFNSHPDRLRVLLSIEVDNQDEIKVLHWERLCAPVESEWRHLALDQRFLFSQCIKTDSDRRYPPIERRDLRALILVASPDNLADFRLTPFDVKATVENVKKALGKIPCDVLANNVEEAIGAPTLNQLCDTLSNAQKPYGILHIVCHGRLSSKEDNDNQLYWAKDDNSLEFVSGNKLLENLCHQKQLPYFTFFSTCESADPRAESGLGGLAQRFVRELAMPAVVAMTRKVSMKTALELGEKFYQRLRESGKVDLALVEATAGLGDRDDIIVPALFSRLGRSSLFNNAANITDCPFPGLQSFANEEYHRFFFGRDSLVLGLKKELSKHNFLIVVGPSGSGKSSVVLAGLIPALQREDSSLELLYLTPDRRPVEDLEQEISNSLQGSKIFVIDQFEELFTCTKEEQRELFVKRLIDISQEHKVILTLRSDFIANCNDYPDLMELIERRQKWVRSMSAEVLLDAVKKQLDEVGLKLEPGLESAILSDLEGEPGEMPLLQFVLQELWNSLEGEYLCHDKYEKMKRMKGAISSAADDFYDQLDPKEQKHLRYIFEKLTYVDSLRLDRQANSFKDTRKRINLNDLAHEHYKLDATKYLIKKLADKRLISISSNQTSIEIEVAHEALIRYWPRMQDWLKESRDRLKLQQQIAPLIQYWQTSKEDDKNLLRGNLLDKATQFLKEDANSFSKSEVKFIRASEGLPNRNLKPSKVAIYCLSTAVLISLARILGIMQPLELAGYDHMMRHKPHEEKEDKILIVGIDENDIQSKLTGIGVGQNTIRDKPLQQLLEKLQQHNPKVIALDLARDRPSYSKELEKSYPSDPLKKLSKELKRENIVGICTASYGSGPAETIGVQPPPEISDRIQEQVGFSNFREDSTTPVRIQPLVHQAPDSTCQARNSFSYAIARRYLEHDSKDKASITIDSSQDFKVGNLSVKNLTGLAGGYQGDPSQDPLQKILLNYRSYQGNPRQFVRIITLQDLENKISQGDVKDKIVMIGINSELSGDYVVTPYGSMSGVIVQAQMVSQLINAASGKRALIWYWPWWIDTLWISTWSFVGGFMIWQLKKPNKWFLGIGGVSLIGLPGVCYIVFASQSGWIPLIPSIVSLLGASAITASETLKIRQGFSRKDAGRFTKIIRRIKNLRFIQVVFSGVLRPLQNKA